MKRVLLSFLLICLLFSMTSISVFADNEVVDPAAIKNTYVFNDITYFNINSNNVASSKQLFIKDCLSAVSRQYLDAYSVSFKGGESFANLWQYAALEVQRQLGTDTDTSKFGNQFDDVLFRYLTLESLDSTESLESGDNTYNVSSSGLQYSDSLAKAGLAIENRIFQYYSASKGSRDKDDAVGRNSTLASDNTSQAVYWNLISANKTSGTFKKGHYQAVAVVFSDFTLSPILPEDQGSNYVTQTISDKTTSAVNSGVINETSNPLVTTQSLTQSSSVEVTSEVNGSKEYSFGQSLGASLSFADFAEINIELSYSQAIANGWSNSETQVTTNEVSTSVELTVPPYSSTMIATNEREWITRTSYNCPVALGYKVTVVEYTLDPSSNNADAITRTLAVYGNDARAALYKYAVTEASVISSDGINWNSNASSRDVAQTLAKTVPISSTGAYIETTNKVITSRVVDFSPVYPLTEIKTSNNIKEINMSIGEHLYVDDILLEGYNSKGGQYCNFNASEGGWVLVDENGIELSGTSGSSIAKLVRDPVSNELTLNAESNGVVYLKYKIKENVYSSSLNPENYANNSNIKTAVIKVTVGPKVSSGITSPTIDNQKNNYNIYVSKDSMLDDIRELGLDADIAKSGDIASYCLFTSTDDTSNGVRLSSYTIDKLSDGIYYVRAVMGNHFSEYAKINLKDSAMKKLLIPESHTFVVGNTLRLSSVYVLATDNSGKAVDADKINWYCDGIGKISEDILHFNATGEMIFYAECQGVTSNKMTVSIIANEEVSPDIIDSSCDEIPPKGENSNPETSDSSFVGITIFAVIFMLILLILKRQEKLSFKNIPTHIL